MFSLSEGTEHPALSLYVDVREDGFEIENYHTEIALVPIVTNLRHHNTARLDAACAQSTLVGGTQPSGWRGWLRRAGVAWVANLYLRVAGVTGRY